MESPDSRVRAGQGPKNASWASHSNTILTSITSVHCGHDCRYGTDEAAFYSGKCTGFPNWNRLYVLSRNRLNRLQNSDSLLKNHHINCFAWISLSMVVQRPFPMDYHHPLSCYCCGQLWVWHMFCGQCLWWVMPPNEIHGSSWNTIRVSIDHMDLCQTHCKQVPDFSRAPRSGRGHVGNSQYNWLPLVPTYGSTWVVLWLFLQARSLYVP